MSLLGSATRLRAMAGRHINEGDVGALTRDAGAARRNDTDDDVMDPDTGVMAPPVGDRDTVYEGRALVLPEGAERIASEGDRQITTARYRLLLPHTSPAPLVGDEWTSTSSMDPRLVGRPLRVVDVLSQSALVARQSIVEDRQP